MYSLHQVERFDAKRDFIKISLCKDPTSNNVQFCMWGQDVQEVMEGEECPMTIEPRVATVPKHGNHSFQASLSGRLAGLHKYRFVAKGRYAAGEGDGKSAEQKNLERTRRRETGRKRTTSLLRQTLTLSALLSWMGTALSC